MNILVSAGNTQTPIDRVRCITNVFSGRTVARVAAEAAGRGHAVTLLTSHLEVVDGGTGVRVRPYRTFDDLDARMGAEVTSGTYDVVIHAAAVGDYHVAGVFTHRDGRFEDAAAGKVKSHHPELWLRLVPAPKLIDKVRAGWGFAGTLAVTPTPGGSRTAGGAGPVPASGPPAGPHPPGGGACCRWAARGCPTTAHARRPDAPSTATRCRTAGRHRPPVATLSPPPPGASARPGPGRRPAPSAGRPRPPGP